MELGSEGRSVVVTGGVVGMSFIDMTKEEEAAVTLMRDEVIDEGSMRQVEASAVKTPQI